MKPPGTRDAHLFSGPRADHDSRRDVKHTLHLLSQYHELLPGDLVCAGTPAGVPACVSGDRLRGGVDGVDVLSIVIGPPRP